MESKPKQPGETKEQEKEPTPLERARMANQNAKDARIPGEEKFAKAREGIIRAAELEILTQYVESHPGTEESQNIEALLRGINDESLNKVYSKESLYNPSVWHMSVYLKIKLYLELAESGLEAYNQLLETWAKLTPKERRYVQTTLYDSEEYKKTSRNIYELIAEAKKEAAQYYTDADML